MGDFNIDLFKNNTESRAFEDITYSNGFAPLISIATHQKPGSASSCIDNILCNNVSQVLFSGSMSEKLLHHIPIFQLTELPKKVEKNMSEIITQYYDYSNTKIDNAIKYFLENAEGVYNKWRTNIEPGKNFDEFLLMSNSASDKSCKLEVPKTTKRNQINNPWFTEELCLSVEKRHKLYKEWKKSISKKKPDGVYELRQKFETYRFHLQKTVKVAKQNFHLGQFEDCKGDMKKTWKLINDIRGKKRKKHFIIQCS